MLLTRSHRTKIRTPKYGPRSTYGDTVVDVLNTQKFSLIIEQMVQEKRCSYMDAVVLYCEKAEMEIEAAAKLLNTKIKQQLEIEYANLNYLPKANTLPI